MTAAIARDQTAGPISANDDSDYGFTKDFGEDGETALTNATIYAEVGYAEQDYLQPVLPETVEPDARAPVARIRRDPHSSYQAECFANLSEPSTAASQELREIDLLGAAYLEASDSATGTIKFESEPLGTSDTQEDTRTPLERFRTLPKKPLSVTDLVTPAWCELKYWYSLRKHGRVRRTPAMQRGSEVHKILEEEVHRTVPAHPKTKEDVFGLRIWNVISGLRLLRESGLTREFEVWGIIDGQVVNGIIDEISTTCTDRALEEQLAVKEQKGKNDTPADQTRISQFFDTSTLESRVAMLENRVFVIEQDVDRIRKENLGKKAYLSDVKTRTSRKLPNDTSMRPAYMQLMLYRQLLADMAANSVDAEVIFKRYRLHPRKPFTDRFMEQLDSEPHSQATDEPQASPEYESEASTTLKAHNSLLQLWSLMIMELQMTMPLAGEGISKVLKIEFRSSTDGRVLGVKTFLFNAAVFNGYITGVMKFWKGERAPQGVNMEEAFKCGMCEFAEGCEWRLNKDEEAVKASRSRRDRASGVKYK